MISFFFSAEPADPERLGIKGANLAEMVQMGFPVPPGFTIRTEVGRSYLINRRLQTEPIEAGLLCLKKLGATEVSVRSSASVSMPGMMDTILNIPIDQSSLIFRAIKDVFESWNNPRAIKYREANHIPHTLGTAAIVQMMVYGNRPNSGTGVVFTRHPSTGERTLFGEYLPQSQGDVLVSGRQAGLSLEEMDPTVLGALRDLSTRVEIHFKDMQEIEFTVQEGTLWSLQSRRGVRTAEAELKIAEDMLYQELIDEQGYQQRIERVSFDTSLRKLAPNIELIPIAVGKGASPGVGSGRVVFDADEAERLGSKEPIVLVRPETRPEDVHGMRAAAAVLTSLGGLISHAAICARQMHKPCVTGAGDLSHIHEGDVITVDGWSGLVMEGSLPCLP